MAETVRVYSYDAVPTLKRFSVDNSFIRACMGPFGSGKTSACTIEIFKRSKGQEPDSKGFRNTRWAVVRNSYPQLRDTTHPTFMNWLGDMGEWRATDYDFHMAYPLDDGTVIQSIIHFRPLDKPSDIKNLLSLELTGAYFNEVREIPKSIVDAMRGRVGRFPPKKSDGTGGATWSGIWMDTNPPDIDHWFYKLFEVDRPTFCPKCKDNQGGIILAIEGACPKCGEKDALIPFVQIYKQPSGRGKDAENLPFLPTGYYANLCAGMDKNFINVYADGNYGYVSDGRPVFQGWDDEKHLAQKNLEPLRDLPFIIGFDNTGRDQAAVICQYTRRGQFRVLHEFVCQDIGTRRLARTIVKPFMASRYPGAHLILTGDPAGVRRSDTDDRNTFQEIEEAFGMQCTPARSNALSARFNAIESMLMRYLGKNEYGLCVSPECHTIVKGFRGEYRMRRLQVVGQERYTDKPEKNLASHIHDALQYAAMVVDDMFVESRGPWGTDDDDYSNLIGARGANWAAHV